MRQHLKKLQISNAVPLFIFKPLHLAYHVTGMRTFFHQNVVLQCGLSDETEIIKVSHILKI